MGTERVASHNGPPPVAVEGHVRADEYAVFGQDGRERTWDNVSNFGNDFRFNLSRAGFERSRGADAAAWAKSAAEVLTLG